MSQPRVVVTGLGAVSAWGWGSEPLWRGLASGRAAIEPAERFDASGHRTRVAGEAPDPPPELAAAHPGWGRLSRADRFAVAAAAEALAGAGLAGAGSSEEGPAAIGLEVGTYFGGSTAGMAEAETFYERLVEPAKGWPRLSFVASQQLNGPGDAVARRLGLRGPVLSISSACSSGALAIGAALDALREGEVDLALAGGADALCQLTYSGFNSLRAVDERPCRPFSAGRAGLSIGEGAGVLVLERLETARARGAAPLAELVGVGASCDAHHMTAPHPQGVGAAAAIEAALADAGLGAEAVAFVNAHGTGTPLNDIAEWRALQTVFNERARRLPVTSTKGSVGHLLGSSGAIEAVATVLCLVAGEVHATPGTEAVDERMEVDLVRASRPLAPGAVGLSISLAFGGANAAVLLRGGVEERLT